MRVEPCGARPSRGQVRVGTRAGIQLVQPRGSPRQSIPYTRGVKVGRRASPCHGATRCLVICRLAPSDLSPHHPLASGSRAAVTGGHTRGVRHRSPLSFPVHDRPLVSVVIPVHDQFVFTYDCLVALLTARNRTTFEVIIVDDASTDETRTLSELVKGLTVLRNDQNRGFVHSCNRGAGSRSGRLHHSLEQRHGTRRRLAGRDASRLPQLRGHRPRRLQAGVSGRDAPGRRRHHLVQRRCVELRARYAR